jgi:SAM-dependent methyltransferase
MRRERGAPAVEKSAALRFVAWYATTESALSFRQYLPAGLAKGLDETHRSEPWEKDFPGTAYYGVHVSIIEKYETAVPALVEFLGRGGLRILESGCGTGRWMAYVQKLGNRAFGLDDSAAPLRVARAHDARMNLVRADALKPPFKAGVFDAAISWYVAEHFPQGPEPLFREIHRLLKPGGLLFVTVPYNNSFRRAVVNPAVRLLGWLYILRGGPLAFTEFRYTKKEMDGFLERTNFEVVRVQPDDFFWPWTQGLSVDLCDILALFDSAPKRLYEFGPFGALVARALRGLGPWFCCSGIFYVARAKK